MPDVVAISGSPRRRSNSTTLLLKAVERLKDMGLDVSVFDASGVDVRPCKGCLKCNRDGSCVQDDFFTTAILPAFRGAYGVLLSSPVYFWGVSAQLKKVLDRFRATVVVKMERERIVCTPRFSPPKDVVLFLAQGEVRAAHYVGALHTVSAFTRGACGGELLDVVVAKAAPFAGQMDFKPERLAKLLSAVGVETDENYLKRLLSSYAKVKQHALESAELLASRISERKNGG